jgi:AraC-like DNA-binding protein
VRAFRAEVGLPPYEYLTHVRVWKAKQLLERGALVADAAHAVGFYDEEPAPSTLSSPDRDRAGSLREELRRRETKEPTSSKRRAVDDSTLAA